jgi:PhnB protein
MGSTTNVPKGYHTVTPYLVVVGVPRFIEFLKAAFGATERMRNLRPDGTVSHAEVEIGDSVVMMGEPQDPGSTMAGMIHLYVGDADAIYQQALRAGASSIREPADQPYGDRMAGIKDQFGNQWWLATPVTTVATR